MGLTDLIAYAKETLRNPREGLRAILDMGLTRRAQLLMLSLVAVVSAIFTHISLSLMPVPDNPVLALLLVSPVQTAMIQMVGMVVTAALVQMIGRMMGGRGSFDEALIAVIWLQVFMLALQLAELIGAATGVTLISLIAALASLVIFPWLFTMFVTEVHRFIRPVKVFFGIIFSATLLIFVLSFVLVAILGPESFAHV
ncbi:YIP1 family protein [Xinfangfangia sp. CPCC 101601]|uniref:YIP1 family protein n=1 Tax=Pseudogemmobacter lacusdianii TaxID=3069608 RepID=A0ABU0VW10_9RHOB|nr:YIP1 family protein [Xinfangfangia sp. CPCC 101601]MDQ2065410.1 YIP1 family protein [Xinfangfangia sp. CPCC 101601]